MQALRRPEQLALEGAEASADPSFILVTRPDGVSLFALDANPQGLFPSEFVWRQVLDLASSHDGVRALEIKRKAGNPITSIAFEFARPSWRIKLMLHPFEHRRLLHGADVLRFLVRPLRLSGHPWDLCLVSASCE